MKYSKLVPLALMQVLQRISWMLQRDLIVRKQPTKKELNYFRLVPPGLPIVAFSILQKTQTKTHVQLSIIIMDASYTVH